MWNVTDKLRKMTTRFTGWADIPLSEIGKNQAEAAGRALEKAGFKFDAAFTSVLSRSRMTLQYASPFMQEALSNCTSVCATWRLNERHYGALVGMSKEEAENTLGRDKVLAWRRSWSIRPPPMTKNPLYHSYNGRPSSSLSSTNDTVGQFDAESEIWSNAITIHSPFVGGPEVKTINRRAVIPKSESLADTAARIYPLWSRDILPRIRRGETVLVVGHSNTIRSIVKHIDNIPDFRACEVVIPSAIPLYYSFAEDPDSGDCYPLGEPASSHSGTFEMRGRFIVTKELLELSLKASQNLEMSENLDEGSHFKDLLASTLEKVTRRDVANQTTADNGATFKMAGNWMTFSVPQKSST